MMSDQNYTHEKMCACVWVERLEMGAKKVCFEPYFVFTGKSFKIDQISLHEI